MTIEISANYIIDEMSGLLDEYQARRYEHKKQHPYGQYIDNETPYGRIRNSINQEKVEAQLNQLQWTFADINLYAVARQAKKWYEATNWQFCLSENMAEKILLNNSKVQAKKDRDQYNKFFWLHDALQRHINRKHIA